MGSIQLYLFPVITKHYPSLRKASRSNPCPFFQTACEMTSRRCFFAWPVSTKKTNCILLGNAALQQFVSEQYIAYSLALYWVFKLVSQFFSSLQHNIPSSFCLVLVFWNLLGTYYNWFGFLFVTSLLLWKKSSAGEINSHFVGGVRSLSSHSFSSLWHAQVGDYFFIVTWSWSFLHIIFFFWN